MLKTQKTLAEQLTCAQARARKAHITLVCIGQGANGFKAIVTSERDASTEYTITRDGDGNLQCTCPATVVCKHIGAALLAGTSFHSNAIPASALPVTPNPNRQPQPETAAAWAASLDPVGLPAIFDAPQPEPPAPAMCWECGYLLRADQERYCDWCDDIMDFLRTNAYQPVADFPLLLNITQEVAIATAEMEADGFVWDERVQAWVRAIGQELLDELLTERALEAAEAFDAEYANYLDELPGALVEVEA